MEDSDVDVRETVLSLHLGALYSCPAELQTKKSNLSTRGGTSAFSARCFLPAAGELQRRGANGGSSEVNPADSSLSAAKDASDNAYGPVREVFCRVVPRPPVSAADRTAALNTAGRHDDGSLGTLSEALGLIYRGVHVINSQQPSITVAAGPEAREEGGAVRPPSSSTPQLVPCNRLHAGLSPLYAPVVESTDGTFLLFACLPFRLTALTQLCREVRGARGVRGRRSLHSVDLIVRFVFYQLLRAVDFLHSRGITVGNLGSSNILLTEHLWVQVAPSIPLLLGDGQKQPRHLEGPPRRPLVATPRRPLGEDLPLTYRWVKGMVSNLEYLLAVNAAAGRVVGDRSCHPIVPWVCDFTRKMTEEEGDVGGAENGQEDGGGKGWRDLTMTKFRLKKGDAQLDKSYSEGKPPHHVPESLSELTLVVYLARQLPLQVLQDVVRSELVAEEYPKSVARVYSWTPDECIPEFYTEPGVFRSAHGGVTSLPDLDVPPWCDGSPEDFIRYHRSLLEGERVSRSLHRWLDITFGYCLKGQAAVDNKNVPLPRGGVTGTGVPTGFGAAGLRLSDKDRPAFVQIFRHPHPPRKLNARASAPSTAAASKPRVVATPTAPRAADDGLAMRDRDGSAVSAGGGGSGSGGGESDGTGAGEARASIFGVAFDDYIGEEGVLHPPLPATAGGGDGGGGGGGCGGGARFDRNNGGGAGEACASIEEDRRALAFAHDVELRLNPWYGRPRTGAANDSDPASPAAKNAGVSLTGTTRRGGYEDNGSVKTAGGGSREKRERRREMGMSLATTKKDDLLACGCVLAEMCAGEPVFAGPSSPSLEGPSGVGGKSSWLEAAAELPLALRRTIRGLTHPDPEKRPSARDLLSTTEPTLHATSSHTSLPSWRAGRAGRPHPAPPPPPAYRGLFPPYMRDVYAFLAAVHQEETAQKRLVLAAAALPVLQVPLHAFSLAVPYLVALLEAFSPKAKEFGMRKQRNTSNDTEEREGRATATKADKNGALLRQERGGVETRREGGRQRPDQIEAPTSSTGLPTPVVPPPSTEQGDSQPPRLMAAAVAVTVENRPTAAVDAEALEAAKHAAAWVSVFDLCAARLGPSLATEVLLPSVLATLEGVQSSERASRLMDSNIWGVIASRVGNESFLRHVFPLLLGWLERGVEIETDSCVRNDRCQSCAVQSTLRQSDEAGVSKEETTQATQAAVVSPRRGRPSAAAPMSGNVGQAKQPSPRAIGGFDERGGRRLTAASRVQVAAATSVSKEMFGRLGPTLAARYLVPALVDCLGRLATTAAAEAATSTPTSTAALHAKHSKACPTTRRPVSDSTTTAPTAPPAPARGSELDTKSDGGGIDGAPAPLPPPRLVGAAAEHRRSISREFCGCLGDPASRALLQYCRTRGATEEYPDVGVGGGTSFLVLSRALAEMCLQMDTEEVTVPLVLSRLFHQILPSLAPVLAQRGGASATATGFRSVLEVTSLLDRLLPTLCPETISHFYVGMRPPASPAETETTCSVPWLFLAMPLPPPVVGLDVPYSADGGETSGDDSETSTEELERSSNLSAGFGSQGDSLGGPATGDKGGAVGVSGRQYDKPPPGVAETVADGDVSVRFVCQVEAARLLATTAMGVLGDDGGGSAEEKEGKEECARVLQAGEAFFAAFERSYCGLALSSSTMVAALKLARELHSPLASLFGFDVMHRCVPSASGRTVAWLSEGAVRTTRQPATTAAAAAAAAGNTTAPREGFDDLGAEEGNTGVVISGEWSGGEARLDEEGRTAQLRSTNRSGLGSGAALVSSWEPVRSANQPKARSGGTGEYGSPFRTPEDNRDNVVELGRNIPLPPEDGIYISPPMSPENVEQRLHSQAGFGGGTAAETASGQAEDEPRPSAAQPALLNRVRRVVKQHLISDGGGAPSSTSARIAGWLQPGRQAARTAASTLSYFSSRADRDQEQNQVSRPREEGRGGTRSPAAETVEDVDSGRISRETKSSPSGGGVPAWGHKSDKRDPLLAYPSSTLPPSSSRGSRGDGVVGDRVRAPDQYVEQQSPQLSGAEGPGHRLGRSRSLGAAPPETVGGQGGGDDSEPEEWPSLLGAIGSKTPSAPGPALPSLAVRALSSPFSRAVPAPTAAAATSFPVGERGDFAASARVRRETAEAAATAVTSATNPGSQALSASPSRLSPFFLRGTSSTLPSPPPSPPPPLPLPPPALGALVSSVPPPPLPGTCRGVGVEVRARLRERALFTGTRDWGESGRIPGGRRGQALGEGFEPDAVGSLFPLSMALQTSFLAHPDKAAVTSMAVEKRSESILLTGSAEGEVRVWSLREHPVSRLSGFRSGDSGAGGGSGGARSGAHAAITQLGIFEGAGRAAALDGLVRIWDVERSKGLAICHQGAQRDAPSLTAFSLSGCGDGTTPPLDESEWKELPFGASGSFSAPDDQQLTASYGGGIVHFDCRQGRLRDAVGDLFPVAQWNVDARLQSLLAHPSSKGQIRGDHAHGSSSRRHGDAAPLPVGLCSVCEGEGAWLAAGSGAGQVVVFDKRRPGGRPLFWWNAHGGAVVGVFHVARDLLLTMSRDRTAVLWDLSRSRSEFSGIDSTGTRPTPQRHPSWGAGAYTSEEGAEFLSLSEGGTGGGGESGYGESAPARVSTTFGLPNSAPGMCPATVAMLPLSWPRPPTKLPSGTAFGNGMARGSGGGGSAAAAAVVGVSMFGEGFSARGNGSRATGRAEQEGKLPVLFAASGDRMVASVVRRELGGGQGGGNGEEWEELEEEVHPVRLVGPSGKTVDGKKGGGGMRSASGGGGLVVRSVAVLPLRRLSLLGCADGWVRVGT